MQRQEQQPISSGDNKKARIDEKGKNKNGEKYERESCDGGCAGTSADDACC
jgi:hypothetical protein